MKTLPLLLIFSVTALTAQAQIVFVGNWQFNTPGDNEGWTAQTFTVNNLHVGNAVSGSEIVLTSDNLRNQADAKIYFPNTPFELPGGSTGWDKLVIRIRQIGNDGVTPVAFNNSGAFATLGSQTPWGTLAFINGNTGTGSTVPVTQVTEAGQWNIFTYDLSNYTSGTMSAQTRMDPVSGFDAGGGVIQGNFEIDYVTLSAFVPEPSTYALLAGALTLSVVALKRRRNRACNS